MIQNLKVRIHFSQLLFIPIMFILLTVGILRAQDMESRAVITRFTLSGTSDRSEPPGYKIYSSLAFSGGIRYYIIPPLAAELTIAVESREVDFEAENNREISLGSIDYLAFVLVLQYHLPLEGVLSPCGGLGINFNRYFEKSGAVNELGVPNSFGFTVQLGIDIDLSSVFFFTADVELNQMEVKLIDNGRELSRIMVHPASFSLGIGAKF